MLWTLEQWLASSISSQISKLQPANGTKHRIVHKGSIRFFRVPGTFRCRPPLRRLQEVLCCRHHFDPHCGNKGLMRQVTGALNLVGRLPSDLV
jgi:hypothetical protein